MDDPVIGLQYLLIEGEDIDPQVKLATRVARPYTPDEVLARAEAASTPAEHFQTVREAAVAAPRDFDQRFFDVIRKGMAHPDPSIRRTSLLSFGYVGWREFRPVLLDLIRSDPDADVREEAQLALDAAEQCGWKGKA